MKNIIQGSLLAALCVVGVSSARAQYTSGDLIAGFTTGAGNDLVLDIGPASSLTSGETWNIASLGFTAANNVSFGVVGSLNGGTFSQTQFKITYGTVPTGAAVPGNINGRTAFGTIAGPINSIGSDITTGSSASIAANDSSGNSWNTQTVTGGAGATYFSAYGQANGTPNATTPASFTSGSVVEDFYGVAANNTPGVFDGNFALSSSGVLTFTAVPEPTTYGLIAGLGLLALCVRRQVLRKA